MVEYGCDYGCDYDYDGDMDYYQKQLAAKGITREMLDMDRFIGLTAGELQHIVDSVYIKKKGNSNTGDI